jgi:hypothetical protein
MSKKRKPPAKISYHLEKKSGELFARWRTGSSAVGCFMLFWLSGWTVACVFLAYLAWTERSAEAIGGAAVFWCGWLIGLMVLLRKGLGRESIRLSAEGVRTTSSALYWRAQQVPLCEILSFGSVRDDGAGSEGEKRLDVRTVGRPLRVGEGLAGDEIVTLAEELRGLLKQLRASHGTSGGYPREAAKVVFRERLSGELLAPAADDKQTEIRTSGDRPIELPSDSRFQRRDDFDSVTVWRRGKFYLAGLLALAVIMGFWNGVVGMFFYELWLAPVEQQPKGVEWIWRFVFLIPFEVLGALFALGVLLIAVEPFRVWTFRFATREILDRLAWFGLIRLQKRHAVAGVDRIEVRRVPYETVRLPKRLPLASLWAPPGCPTYDLVPIDSSSRDICRIEGLTFGEACWLADTLLRSRREWFR